MRIALISPLFESVPPRLYGGTERVVYNLSKGLKESNTEVTLFAAGDSTIDGRIIPVVSKALRLREDPVKDPYSYNLKMLDLVAKHAHEFDVIHNHHDYWMLPLAHLCNTPVVTTLHGRLDLPDITHAFHSFPKNTFVSISDSQRKPLPALPWVSTVHHGIDIKKFRFTAEHGKYLAFLGRISPEKRPDWAIALAKKSGIPIKLAAKIEGTADEAYFEAQIKPLIDGSFVQFVGEISEDEKSDFLGNALALAFPIDWPEPFGLVTIEALACGTPVLARPCGAMPEILKDGITGFCRSDVNELTKLIPQINRLDRHKCREWVEQRFNYKRMADDYLKVYKTLSKIRTLRAA